MIGLIGAAVFAFLVLLGALLLWVGTSDEGPR